MRRELQCGDEVLQGTEELGWELDDMIELVIDVLKESEARIGLKPKD